MNKYATLGVLYLTQTLPMAFIVAALPVLIRNQQWSLTMVASVQLLALPWSIKFLWAPFIDRYSMPVFKGKRRGWMISLQMILFLIFMSLLGFGWGTTAFILILILVFVCATHDIALDAWAVENLSINQRPTANAIQIGAIHAAKLIGGSLLLYVFIQQGFEGIVLIFALGTIISIAALFRTQEVSITPSQPFACSRSQDDSQASTPYWLALKGFFQIPKIKLWLGGLIGFRIGSVVFLVLVRPWLVDLGWSLPQIASLFGWSLATSALAACGLSGYCIRKLGSKACFTFVSLALFFSIVAFPIGVYCQSSHFILGAILCAFSFFESFCLVIFFSHFMKLCRSGHSGTDFTVQQCIYALTLQLGIIGGFIAERIGYTPVIITASLILLISIPAVLRSLSEENFEISDFWQEK